MKKIVLSLITFLSVAMCSVVAFIGLSSTPKTAIGGGHYKNIGEEVIIDDNTPKPIEKPSTITYAPNTISVQKGGDSINYNYTPDINQKDETTPTHTVAYEYCFGNPMDRKTAVNLKSIDTTGVNVSYYYSTSKIDTTETLVGETDFTLQELEIKGTTGDQVYIYVLVGPEDVTIPTTFTQSIVWYYGIPKEVPIIDNVTGNVVDTQTIVSGQKIDENTLDTPDNFTRTEQGKIWDENTYNFVEQEVTVTYYFDAWFYDKDFTQIVDGNNSAGKKIYARYHNIDPSKTEYWGYSDEGYTFSPQEYYDNNWYGAGYDYCGTTGILHPVIPTTYDDGVNGKANVVGIGYNTFNNYPGVPITSVYLPVSLTSIGEYAFYFCSSLTSIDLSGCTSLTSIGEYAFYYCSSLTSITIPSGVTSIGTYAFSDCSSLTSIDLSECTSLTSIGDSAFSYCSSLTSITLPNSLTSIGSNNFSSSSLIYNQYDNGKYLGNDSNPYMVLIEATSTSITSCKINSNTKIINNSAFSYCKSLTSITIPSSVTSIGDNAFNYCYALAEIYNLSSLSITIGNTSGSTNGYLGQYAKVIHTSLDEPSVLTTIGGIVYYPESTSSYTALTVLDKTVTSVTLDSRTTSINQSAFYECSRLTTITLPSSVTSIGNSAFGSCISLTSITIPSSVKSIGSSAFSNCWNLYEVYNLSSLSITKGSYDNGNAGYYAKVIHTSLTEASVLTTIGGVVYYPESTSSYTALTVLDKTVTSITLDSRTTSINQGSFKYCRSLTSIDLSKCTQLTSIGYDAFRDCSSLTSITIPASVTKISTFVFCDCSKLTSITFEDTSTWYYTSNYKYTDGTQIDVTDPSANATYFKSTYLGKYWYKV